MDLGTLPGGSMSTGNGINEAGQVVGYSTTTETGGAQAYLWSDGWMADLGDLGYGGSSASDLNDAGLVVGSATASTDGTTHAVLWTITPLPPPSGRDPDAPPTDRRLDGIGCDVEWLHDPGHADDEGGHDCVQRTPRPGHREHHDYRAELGERGRELRAAHWVDLDRRRRLSGERIGQPSKAHRHAPVTLATRKRSAHRIARIGQLTYRMRSVVFTSEQR